jgi:hypothetical protein
MAPRTGNGESEPPKDGQGQGQQDQALSDRVGKLEAGQDSLAGKLDQVLSMLSGGKDGEHPKEPTAPAAGPGNPAGVAHEIRAQLDERDRKEREKKDADATAGTLAELKATVAQLTEKQPDPEPRRVERIMGWSLCLTSGCRTRGERTST